MILLRTSMQTKLETTLASLVAIPSLPSSPDGCQEVIELVRNEIETLGLFVTSGITATNPWLIATTADTQEPDIMLVAHLDVVPGPSELFTMRRDGDRLYGRGVYDMKFAAACYIEFFKEHTEKLRDMNIGLLFTTDEEGDSASMSEILELGWRPKLCLLPDGGDNWHIEERAKGLYGVELTAHGKAAHGSRPWEGENALHRLMDVLAILRASFPSSSPAHPTLAINELHAGSAINQIADEAIAKIDFRSFSKDDIINYRSQLAQLAVQYDIDVRVVRNGLPLIFNKDAPVIQSFLRALQEQTGHEVSYCDSYGASDARYFAIYDIPCIIAQPYGGGRHSPDEWLLAGDLPLYYELIERWLLQAAPLHSKTASTP